MSFGNSYAWVGRLGLTCVIICLAAIPLSGCVKPAPPPEPVTITFAYPEVDAEYYEPLAQEFNELHLHITVELLARPWNALDDLEAGDVDVFVTEPFALSELQERGDILSLDPFIERDDSFGLSDFYPGTVELLSIEGRTWAIPAGLDVLVMFYNQDLFDQHAVPYPEIGWTWEDFLNSAVAVSDPDAGIFGYTTTGPTTSPTYFDAALVVYQRGGRLFDDLQDPTRATFDDPATIEALEWYASLYHEYDVAPTPQEARKAFSGSQYAFFEGLRRGKVGMWIGGLSDRGGLTWPAEWFVDWGMAPLPRNVQAITQAEAEGYAIYSQTQHRDACWQWIAFLGEQMPYRLMPARKSIAESTAYEQHVGADIAAVARVSMENAVLINPRAFGELGETMDIFAEAVGKIVNEDSTPQEAMVWAQEEAELRMKP